MLTDKIECFRKQLKSFLLVLEFILVIGVGYVDYITGPEYSLLLLYLVSVLTTACLSENGLPLRSQLKAPSC
jgi:hypothetical protein